MATQSTKALQPDQNERLREVLRKIVAEHDGVVSRAAKTIGVSHSLIFEVLDGRRGAGTKLLQALSDYTGRSTDDLLGREVRVEREGQELHEGDSVGSHPDLPRVRAEFVARAERRGERVIPEVLEEALTFSMSRLPPRLSVEFLRRLYEAVLQAREDNPEA